jgi:hypothetical protein
MAIVNVMNSFSNHLIRGATSASVGYLSAKVVTLATKTAITGCAGAVWGVSSYIVSQLVDPIFKKLSSIDRLNGNSEFVLDIARLGSSITAGYFLTNLVTPLSLKGILSLSVSATVSGVAVTAVAVGGTVVLAFAGLAAMFWVVAHNSR